MSKMMNEFFPIIRKGTDYICIECKKYYIANVSWQKYCSDKCRYRHRSKDPVEKERAKEWRRKNPNHMKEWRRKNPNYDREWRRKNPNYNREWRRKKREERIYEL